jgi:hypothetical protein
VRILAIDPGPKESAYVLYEDGRYVEGAKVPNLILTGILLGWKDTSFISTHVAIEMIACYGMSVGAEVFETCTWIGRYEQLCESLGIPHSRIFRQQVKLHLCRSVRAKDGNIRQAILDRFGPGKELAIGTKKNKGPLYGVAGDVWAALAVAITYADTKPAKVAG